jgi:hypothetical protein
MPEDSTVSTEAAPAPASPEAEHPKSLGDKIGAALPIALTALATAFAGMSTSELQQAMFWRSYAAQDQAKATSQWTLAGFKRDRSLICQTTAAQLRATAGNPANPFAGATDSLASQWLAGQGPPTAMLPEVRDERLRKLLADIQTRVPEADLISAAGKIPAEVINAAIDDAEKAVEQLDREWEPTLKDANRLVSTRDKETATAAHAAMFELEQRRYRIEASLNQGVGFLYEARVKVSSAESEKHQRKSKRFFYAMLAAQAGATIASLAMARRKKSLLWAIAGFTGVVALAIGGYVYLSEM